MNYRLSIYADRVNKKNGYVLLCNGSVISSKVVRFHGDNIKENALSILHTALLASRTVVSHDDVITIEVQNPHLYNWLDGLVDYDGYDDYLDKVFDVLEMIDCRYKFYFTKTPFAKGYIKSRDFSREKLSSVEDMMADFV